MTDHVYYVTTVRDELGGWSALPQPATLVLSDQLEELRHYTDTPADHIVCAQIYVPPVGVPGIGGCVQDCTDALLRLWAETLLEQTDPVTPFPVALADVYPAARERHKAAIADTAAYERDKWDTYCGAAE